MSLRAKLIAVAAAILLIAVVTAVLTRPDSGPVVEGKPIAVWLRLYKRGNVYEHAQADQALRKAGTNAIPIMLRMLRERDSKPKLKVVQLLRSQRWLRLRPGLAMERNEEAAAGFHVLGPVGGVAVPELLKIYEEQITMVSSFNAATALAGIGPAASNAVPRLILGLTNSITELRLASITALAEIRSYPDLTVPALRRALQDPQAIVRSYAQLAFRHLGLEATNIPRKDELRESQSSPSSANRK